MGGKRTKKIATCKLFKVFQTFYYDYIYIIKAGMCTFICANVTAHNTKSWYISIHIGEKNPSVRKLCYCNTQYNVHNVYIKRSQRWWWVKTNQVN